MSFGKVTHEIRAKWLEALRSGNYKQGKFGLRTGDTFCCLGVLCDTVDPTAWVKDKTAETYTWHNRGGTLHGTEIKNLIGGLDSKAQGELVDMNDSAEDDQPNPTNFAEIADWIEEKL